MTNPQPGPRALALYPRRYRAAHGEEITQLYRAATDDTDARTRRSEEWDIAAHALRVRTALTAHQPLGRLALTTAPYALAAAVSLASAHLTMSVTQAVRDFDPAELPGLATLVVLVATLAAGALACAGRWPRARVLSALPIVLLAVQVDVPVWLVPLLAVVVLMPSTAEAARTDRRLALALAALTWLPVLGAALVGAGDPALGMVGAVGPTMIVLALRAAAPGCRPRHVLAVLFASVPWAGASAGSPIGVAIVVVALTVATGAGRLAGTRRRLAAASGRA